MQVPLITSYQPRTHSINFIGVLNSERAEVVFYDFLRVSIHKECQEKHKPINRTGQNSKQFMLLIPWDKRKACSSTTKWTAKPKTPALPVESQAQSGYIRTHIYICSRCTLEQLLCPFSCIVWCTFCPQTHTSSCLIQVGRNGAWRLCVYYVHMCVCTCVCTYVCTCKDVLQATAVQLSCSLFFNCVFQRYLCLVEVRVTFLARVNGRHLMSC